MSNISLESCTPIQIYEKTPIFSNDESTLQLTNLLLQDLLLLPILTVENSKFRKPLALQIQNGSFRAQVGLLYIYMTFGKDTEKSFLTEHRPSSCFINPYTTWLAHRYVWYHRLYCQIS